MLHLSDFGIRCIATSVSKQILKFTWRMWCPYPLTNGNSFSLLCHKLWMIHEICFGRTMALIFFTSGLLLLIAFIKSLYSVFWFLYLAFLYFDSFFVSLYFKFFWCTGHGLPFSVAFITFLSFDGFQPHSLNPSNLNTNSLWNTAVAIICFEWNYVTKFTNSTFYTCWIAFPRASMSDEIRKCDTCWAT